MSLFLFCTFSAKSRFSTLFNSHILRHTNRYICAISSNTFFLLHRKCLPTMSEDDSMSPLRTLLTSFLQFISIASGNYPFQCANFHFAEFTNSLYYVCGIGSPTPQCLSFHYVFTSCSRFFHAFVRFLVQHDLIALSHVKQGVQFP